ncbi:MAG: sensor histidine kinase [Patescibacteria group bacterium]
MNFSSLNNIMELLGGYVNIGVLFIFIAVLLFLVVSGGLLWYSWTLFRELKKCQANLDHTSKTMFQKNLELIEANKNLNELNDIKKIFIETFSHQIRTPISAIKWSACSILDEIDNKKEIKENINIIKDRAEKINYLSNKFLQASEIAGLESIKELKRCDNLADILKDIVEDNRQNFKDEGINLSLDIKKKLPSLNINYDFLKLAINNLLENARWYNHKGGSVYFRAYSEKDSVIIEVEDTGIGISKDKENIIFQKFYRLEEARKSHPDGSGLGLYIVNKIVNIHKGKIEVESIENRGSLFRIILPVL